MKQGKGKRVQVITNRTKQDKNRTKWANNEGKYERGGTSKRKDINGNNLYFVNCVNRSH